MICRREMLVSAVLLAGILTSAPFALAQEAQTTRVAILFAPSGKGDRSYNDMALAGIIEARKETKIRLFEIQPARADEYQRVIQRLASQGVEMIVGVGFLYADAFKAMAPRLPNVDFLLIDADAGPLKNVRSVTFRPEEGSFLVGMVAGSLDDVHKVGFIGGMNIPIITKFECGFRAGVARMNALRKISVTVTSEYIGDTPQAFSSPGKAREIATSMYRNGIDVIYHAAGASGNGVITAAVEQNRKVIGVDTDQSYLAPQNVVTSMRKRIDFAVRDAIRQKKSGSFTGGVVEMSLANNGIDYVPSRFIDENLRTLIAADQQRLIVGELKACPES
jgi:basic membrane protein A and related proteins